MKTLWITLSAASFFFASSAFAQEVPTTGTGSTGTGRTTAEIFEGILARHPVELPALRKELLVPDAKQTAWETQSDRLLDRLAQHRRDCREAIRRANRDTLMRTTLQCYRSDLLQEMQWLRDYTQYLVLVPLLNEERKLEVTATIDALIDAQAAIVDGIDAQLFEHVESLQEAKKNLRAQYRLPYYLAITKLRADRELTINNFIVKKLLDLSLQKDRGPVLRHPLLEDSAHCLETASLQLTAVIGSTDWISAKDGLGAAHVTLAQCEGFTDNLLRQEQKFEAQKMENEEAEKR